LRGHGAAPLILGSIEQVPVEADLGLTRFNKTALYRAQFYTKSEHRMKNNRFDKQVKVLVLSIYFIDSVMPGNTPSSGFLLC
jgi:hypothetical protein